MSHLVPCPGCPFCGRPLDLANSLPPPMPRARLTRAALFAFGASIVGAAVAAGCGGNVSSGPDLDGAAGAGGASSGAGGAVASGGSAGSAGSTGAAGATSDASVNDAGIVAMYGAPPPVDSGADADATDTGWGVPIYGSPPPS